MATQALKDLSIRLAKNQDQGSVIPAELLDSSYTIPQIPVPDMSPLDVPTGVQGIIDKNKQTATAYAGLANKSENRLAQLYGQQLGLSDSYQEQLQTLTPQQAELDQLMRRITNRATALEKAKIQDESDIASLQGKGTDSRLVDRRQAAMTRERSFQRRADAAELAGLAALAELKQGNIQAAKDSIREAIDLKYRDIELGIQAEQFFLNRFDSKEAEARKQANELQIQTIQEAKQLIASAIATGGATEDEITAMMQSQNPEEQAAIAQSVIGRTAASDRQFERSMQSASLGLRQQELELSRQRLQAEMSQSGNIHGTLDGRPQNATQALVGGYANRLLEADRILSDPSTAQFAGNYAYGDRLPNQLQSADRQQFEQAKRNFINAVLRRESGAVIADSEFENADKQYFPQPGDSTDTLKQKAANRNTVINDFFKQANVPRPVFAGDIITSTDGKSYEVADDGVTLIEL